LVIKFYSIDCSHFRGQAWSKGKSFQKRPIEVYLNNEANIGSDALKKRLIKENYFEKRCQKCLNTTWLDSDIPLELHHIDNNHNNNNLSNLQLLCSNCHSYVHKKQKQKVVLDTIQTKTKYTRKSKLKPEKRKVTRPSYEVLSKQISELGYVKTGKIYNVSDNAIRKWIRMYQKYGML
jgi:5-methylcytosine-specific restriction endonuclease McrA